MPGSSPGMTWRDGGSGMTWRDGCPGMTWRDGCPGMTWRGCYFTPEPSNRDLVVQVPPIWIHRHDQVDLPLPRPVLDVLLALNGVVGRAVLLEIDEVLDAVPFGEARRHS